MGARLVVFVVGAPGVGKTSLVRNLLGTVTWMNDSPKWTEAEHGVAAGHYKGGTFDGADTVPYNGVVAALEHWWKMLAERRSPTYFDGDRFSNASTLKWLSTNAPKYRVVGLHLYAPQETLDERRAQRGSKQNAAWMKGRVTKAARFATLLSRVLQVDARLETEEMVKQVREWMRQAAQ